MDARNKRLASVSSDGSSSQVPVKHVRRKEPSSNMKYLNGIKKSDVSRSREQSFERIRVDPISTPDTDRPVYLHPVFSSVLNRHQIEGVQFLWREVVCGQGGALLAHTMGLGKTAQVIAFLFTLDEVRTSRDPPTRRLLSGDLKTDRTLILMPPGLITNWVVELSEWSDRFNLFPSDKAFFTKRHVISSSMEFEERLITMHNWHKQGGMCFLGYSLFKGYLYHDPIERSQLEQEMSPKLRRKLLDMVEQQKEFRKLLLDPGPALVIADEAHELRNNSSNISKTVAQLRSKSRIAITASPLANCIKEYIYLLLWVRPEQTHTVLTALRKQFGNNLSSMIHVGNLTPTEENSAFHTLNLLNRYIGYTGGQLNNGVVNLEQIFKFLIAKFQPAIHRRNTSVIQELLTNKTEFIIRIPLTNLQMRIYKEIVVNRWLHVHRTQHAPRENDRPRSDRGNEAERSQTKVLWTAVTYLRTICNHPEAFRRAYYRESLQPGPRKFFMHGDGCKISIDSPTFLDCDDPPGGQISKVNEDKWLKDIYATVENPTWARHSKKMVVLLSLLKACKKVGDQVLLFTHNTASLDYIEGFAVKNHFSVCRLDGSVGFDDRRHGLQCFNTGSHDIYIISTKAGGLGMNMQKANRVIILDTDFSPMWEQQAVGRSYRIGQKKPVYVYYLMTEGSIETKLANVKDWKHRLADILIDNNWDPRRTFRGVHDLNEYRALPVKVAARESFAGEEFWGKDDVLDMVVRQRQADITAVHVASEIINSRAQASTVAANTEVTQPGEVQSTAMEL
ncbi:P-loop containing nucleoside triphosphate hydrolase protein [Geopyxis carbonaria]|nr:P-loop containing nucleoside triphosphate hydrolase protein [Geopyxis carbonaria]